MRTKLSIVFVLFLVGVTIIFYLSNGKASQQEDKPPLPEQASKKEKESTSFEHIHQNQEYDRVSENKEVFVKIKNDELNGTGAKLSFFDRQGILIGEWEYKGNAIEQYYLSKYGNYCLVNMHSNRREEINGKYIFFRNIFIIDKAGKELGGFETSGGAVFWSPKEDYFISMEGEGETKDRDGEPRAMGGTIKAHDPTGIILWERRRPSGVIFHSIRKISPNGKYIILDEDDDTLVMLTKKGKELFKKRFQVTANKRGSVFVGVEDIDNEGNIIVTPTGKRNIIFIIDNKGETKMKQEIDYEPRAVDFSTNNPNEIVVKGREGKEIMILKWSK